MRPFLWCDGPSMDACIHLQKRNHPYQVDLHAGHPSSIYAFMHLFIAYYDINGWVHLHKAKGGGGIRANLLGLPADADHRLDRRDGVLALHKTSTKHQIRGSRVWLPVSRF